MIGDVAVLSINIHFIGRWTNTFDLIIDNVIQKA